MRRKKGVPQTNQESGISFTRPKTRKSSCCALRSVPDVENKSRRNIIKFPYYLRPLISP